MVGPRALSATFSDGRLGVQVCGTQSKLLYRWICGRWNASSCYAAPYPVLAIILKPLTIRGLSESRSTRKLPSPLRYQTSST